MMRFRKTGKIAAAAFMAVIAAGLLMPKTVSCATVPPEGGKYPGSWRATGEFKSFGPLESPVTKDGVTVSAMQDETEEGTAKFKFESETESGEKATSEFTVSIYRDKSVFIPGEDYGEDAIELDWEFSGTDAPGEIAVSAAFAYPDFTQGEYGFLPNVRTMIPLFNYEGNTEYKYGAEKTANKLKSKRIIPICATFPGEPSEDDPQTVWLLVGITDGGDVRMFRMWEFEWSDEEYVVEAEDMSWLPEGAYYDAGTGFIEYFDDSEIEKLQQDNDPVAGPTGSPVWATGLIAVAVVAGVLVIVFILFGRKK